MLLWFHSAFDNLVKNHDKFFLAQFYSIGSPNSKEKNCLFLALYML